jgi:GNAT superfamily N-acetyltransferase
MNMDAQSRIEARLAAANAMENPLSGLEQSFLSVKVDSSFLTIRFQPSPLPEQLRNKCLDLFERNMGDMYQESDWGLNMAEKEEELSHENARFLICSTCNDHNDDDNDYDELLAFAHFRFDVNDDDDPTEQVLYVYELQVDASVRQCGLGRRIMSILELVARRAQMSKTMLTVFKSNKAAIQFYTLKMKYKVDEISPSMHGQIADYEILSKRVN